MDARLAHLLEVLQSTGEISPADLADKLGVTTRSVRAYVSRLNDILGSSAHVELKRNSGYRLVINDHDGFIALISSEKTIAMRAAVPTTPTDRIAYLLNDLLSRDDWVTLDVLASVLFVSRVTISEDLKEVENRLCKFGLKLIRKPYHGVRVDGPEFSRRLCMAACVVPTATDSFGLVAVSEMLEDVADCVSRATHDAGIRINAVAYQGLLVHIAVAVERIRRSCYVPMAADQLTVERATSTFACAESIAMLVGERFDVELPEEEIAYISIHLASKQTLYEDSSLGKSMLEGADSLVISDDVWSVVSRVLERVWDVFRFDFRNDLELRMNLARHMVPLAVRLRYNMHLDNPLLADIKGRFPLAYAMAMEVAPVLAEVYGARVSDEEAGYIALAFALALERRSAGAVKKNILVVCASGAGSARLLEYRYREEFGAYLDRVETCDVNALDTMDLTGIDYVFTTVPLNRSLPVPVCEVGFFLDGDDYKFVRRTLAAGDAHTGIGRFFDQDLFLAHLNAGSKAEVISTICRHIAKYHDAPENFEELVWKRERAAMTSFGNLTAMPHPFEPAFDETFVCVALLDQPVDWGGPEVQAVFMVCVSREQGKDLRDFYARLASLLISETGIKKLISQQDFATLLELLQA